MACFAPPSCSSRRRGLASPEVPSQRTPIGKRAQLLIAFAAIIVIAELARQPCAAFASEAQGSAPITAELKFDADCGLILVPVILGSKTVLAAIDTGSDRTMFDKSLRPLLGKPRRRSRGSSLDGSFEAELYGAPDATVGGLSLEGLPVVSVVDLRSPREALGEPLYGILGIDFLSAYVVQIDFEDAKVRFLGSTPHDAGCAIPLDFRENLPFVEASLGALARRTHFLIDSGCTLVGILEEQAFEDLRQRGDVRRCYSSGSASLSKKTLRRVGALQHVSLRDFEHSELDFMAGPRNVLGVSYLSRFKVTFDFPRATMYLIPRRGAFPRTDSRDASGLMLLQVNGNILVERVAESSPAENAGMRAGDVILNVADDDAAEIHLTVLRRMLSREGDNLELTIRRGRQNFNVLLKLHDWRDYTDTTLDGQRKRDRSN